VADVDPAAAPQESSAEAADQQPKPAKPKCRLMRWKPSTTDVPEVAPVGIVKPGEVYINPASASLPDKKKILLTRPEATGRLELKTVTPGAATAAQKAQSRTYLSQVDFSAFGTGGKQPTARRYRWFDSLHKLVSVAGFLLAIPAIAGAIGAWAILSGLLSPSPTDLNVVRMQAALAWAAEPLAAMGPRPDPAAEAAAATEFERRSIQASACVQSLQGHHGPVPQIPQITCQPQSSSWVQRNGPKVAATTTVIVTVTALGTAWWRTRFQQSL
jgi:hypothetical protein